MAEKLKKNRRNGNDVYVGNSPSLLHSIREKTKTLQGCYKEIRTGPAMPLIQYTSFATFFAWWD